MKSGREIPSALDRKNANIVSGRRRQNSFRDQVGFQELSAKENHRRQENQPGRRDPLHRVDDFVVESKVINEENRYSGAWIEDKRGAARPAVDSDLVYAQREQVCAEKPLWIGP